MYLLNKYLVKTRSSRNARNVCVTRFIQINLSSKYYIISIGISNESVHHTLDL